MTDFIITREHQRKLEARKALGFPNAVRVFANVGRNHPDYGMAPEEHAEAKSKRAVEAANRSRELLAKRNAIRAKATGADQ